MATHPREGLLALRPSRLQWRNGAWRWLRRHDVISRGASSEDAFALGIGLGHKVGGGGAQVKGAFANQAPDGRRLGAGGKGWTSVLGFRAFHRRRGQRRRIIRGLRAFAHHGSDPQSKWQRRKRARCRLEPNGEPSVRAKTRPAAVRSRETPVPRRQVRLLSPARREANRAWRRRRSGRLAVAEPRAARPARLAPM